MKIGIVLPTRGLVFTAVEQAIEREREGKLVKVYRRSAVSPIPDNHNYLTEEALADGCDYIWYIEDDTVAPVGALDSLLRADSDIACVDYGVAGWGCVTHNKEGEVLWCGLGCTLVKKAVYQKMVKPYFRADKSLRLNDWKWIDLPKAYTENRAYGSLDIWFCCQARAAGFKIKQVDGECDHLILISLGKKEVNSGFHQIDLKPRISKRQVI
jgi:hypothetical protein